MPKIYTKTKGKQELLVHFAQQKKPIPCRGLTPFFH